MVKYNIVYNSGRSTIITGEEYDLLKLAKMIKSKKLLITRNGIINFAYVEDIQVMEE